MRLVFAAAVALLSAAPAIASDASTMRVGLIVTGNFAAPLIGAWDSRNAARGVIYHFVVSRSSGVFYELVSVPLREASAIAVDDLVGAAPAVGRCDLRLSGVIYSLEQTARGSSRYDMQYSIQSAEVVTSSSHFEDCKEVAASYASDIPTANGTHGLTLSLIGDGRLIDSATGAEYTRLR